MGSFISRFALFRQFLGGTKVIQTNNDANIVAPRKNMATKQSEPGSGLRCDAISAITPRIAKRRIADVLMANQLNLPYEVILSELMNGLI